MFAWPFKSKLSHYHMPEAGKKTLPISQADVDEELCRAYKQIWDAPAEFIPLPKTDAQRYAEVFTSPTRAKLEEQVFAYTPSPFVQLADQMLGSKRRVWDSSRSPITYEKLHPYMGLPPLTPEGSQTKRLLDSCLFKTMTGAASGAGLGAFMALLFLGIDPVWTTNLDASGSPLTTAQMMRAVWSRKTLLHASRRVLNYAGGFAAFTASFSAIECLLETWRAKSDWKNAACTGSIVGFAYGARRGSIKSGVTSSLFFSAFSLAVDLYQRGALRMPKGWRGRQQLGWSAEDDIFDRSRA